MKPIIVVSNVIRVIIVVELNIQDTDKNHAPHYKALVDGRTDI
jgi:hypothetical protein